MPCFDNCDGSGISPGANVDISGCNTTHGEQWDYLVNFNQTGKPDANWSYLNDIYPSQNTWQEFVPGDGCARIIVDGNTSNDKAGNHPYQDIYFKNIDSQSPLGGPGYRYETRAKNLVIPGFTGFLFSYVEDDTLGNEISFDEIDIEVVAQDTQLTSHDTLPPNGWTDGRFNVWAKSDIVHYLPEVTHSQKIINSSGQPISLIDDEFHVYTIDWYEDKIELYIDDVLQDTISDLQPTRQATFLIGFRDLPWAGGSDITEPKVCLVDYFAIKKL